MQEQIKECVEKLEAKINGDPKRAEVVFSSQTRLVSGVTCEAKIREFEPLVVDEPPGMGGRDAGPNPVELVMAALGTCQEIMCAAIAAKKGVELTKVEVEVRGYLDLKGMLGLDGNTPPGYTEVLFETSIESPEDPKKIEELVREVESQCPVLDTLVRPIPVRGKTRLNGNKLKI